MGQVKTSTVTMGYTEQGEISTSSMDQVETCTVTMGYTEDRERLVLG